MYLIFLYAEYFKKYPYEILQFWKGGLVFTGALLGAFMVIMIIKKILRWEFNTLRVLDILVLSVPIPIIIGRIGCLLTGCCFGKPTNMPWGIIFPLNNRIMKLEHLTGASLHPTQIYEIINGIFCLIILLLVKNKKPKDGVLFAIFIITYGSIRFVNEFFRYNTSSQFTSDFSILTLWNLTLSHNQIICFLFVLCGIVLISILFLRELAGSIALMTNKNIANIDRK
jgi:phosphatidylglycerol:prolipoprotein diacylglycerol transferase